MTVDKNTFTVMDLPKSERPRERLKEYGVENLSMQELFAVILGRGIKGESVLVTSQKLLSEFEGITNIYEASLQDLMKIRGIGFAKACQLVASFELSKRIAKENLNSEKKRLTQNSIKNPDEAVDAIRAKIDDYSKEHFYVVSIDVRSRIIGVDEVSNGTLTASLVHPRETFEKAIRRHSAQIIVAHNHPSGDTEPSDEDIRITKRLIEAGKIMGIDFIDHIIITKDSYCSLKNKGVF